MGHEVTVLCVDDQNLARECVVAIIERAPGVRVAAEARTVKSAIECFTGARPDVTVISLKPRGLDGLLAIRAIRRVDPGARIVVYATDETEAVYLALEAGATGFVLKDAGAADLVRVITESHTRNGRLLDDVRQALEGRCGLSTLTPREVEVLELFSQGLRTKVIAAALRISDHTVKVHVKHAYKKLGVQGRAAALAAAWRRGLVRRDAEPHLAGLKAGRHLPAASFRLPPRLSGAREVSR